jgi:hypothetical protein
LTVVPVGTVTGTSTEVPVLVIVTTPFWMLPVT